MTDIAAGRPLGRVTLAWFTHLFTISGVIWACLAVISMIKGDFVAMWAWLGVALVVDGVDGTMARCADVKRFAPTFDGTVLDNIVDYLTWTFIPAVFIYLHVDMGPRPVAMAMLVLICASSLFCYCNTALKTSDWYFMGFPAAWNVVAVIMWLFATPPVANVVVTVILAVLTVSPLTFVHPFRVRTLRPWNIAAAAAWVVSTAVLIATHPAHPVLALIVWGASGAWLMGISAWRSAIEIGRRRRRRG